MPAIRTGWIQPSNTASPARQTTSAATQGPTYGMKRRMAAREPHRNAYGRPMRRAPDGHAEPERAVDERLHRQVVGDPLGRLVHGLGGRRDPAEADEPDQPVPQLESLEEHEDHENQHQADVAERPQQHGKRPHGRRRRLHHHRTRACRPAWLACLPSGARRRLPCVADCTFSITLPRLTPRISAILCLRLSR